MLDAIQLNWMKIFHFNHSIIFLSRPDSSRVRVVMLVVMNQTITNTHTQRECRSELIAEVGPQRAPTAAASVLLVRRRRAIIGQSSQKEGRKIGAMLVKSRGGGGKLELSLLVSNRRAQASASHSGKARHCCCVGPMLVGWAAQIAGLHLPAAAPPTIKLNYNCNCNETVITK